MIPVSKPMIHPLTPTAVLPALGTLHDCDAGRITEALQALQDVYFPQVSQSALICALPVFRQPLLAQVLRPKQTARPVRYESVPDSGYASAEEDECDEKTIEEEITGDEDEALDLLRSDALERSYAIKWLTGLVKRGDAWIYASTEQDVRLTCLEDASRLLARFAGDASEEALIRTFVFPFRTPTCHHSRSADHSSQAPPITVELNDAPVDGTDHTAVGLQSWGSAIVFAGRMCLDPERYLGPLHPCIPCSDVAADVRTTAAPRRRVLELGAGTGLLSITAAQIFARTPFRGEIKATDYHPSVLDNLARNVSYNCSDADVLISVEKLDWCEVARAGSGSGSEDGDMYDVVLAADVVYHPDHAGWIRGCVERTLKKNGVFWLIMPVRTNVGRHAGLGEVVEAAFSAVCEEVGKGDRLAIVNREEVERMDGVGRADEGGYVLFEIRWV